MDSTPVNWRKFEFRVLSEAENAKRAPFQLLLVVLPAKRSIGNDSTTATYD